VPQVAVLQLVVVAAAIKAPVYEGPAQTVAKLGELNEVIVLHAAGGTIQQAAASELPHIAPTQ